MVGRRPDRPGAHAGRHTASAGVGAGILRPIYCADVPVDVVRAGHRDLFICHCCRVVLAEAGRRRTGMSPVFVDKPSPTTKAPPPVKRVDDLRGSWGMALFIATEAALFLAMFFAYYYTDKTAAQWRTEIPPKLHYSLPMLAVLLTSSVVLHWGEKGVKQQQYGRGRIALAGTIFLGLVFLTLTYFEDMEHLQHLTPRTDAYGSI